MYEGYYQQQSMAGPEDAGLPFDIPDDAKSAAISVAFILVVSTIVLTVMKRSGFRAMVAIGRS